MNITEPDGPESSDQPNWAGVLRDQTVRMTSTLESMDDMLNVKMDANPDERRLLEMLDAVTDARESLQDVLDLLDELSGL